MGVRVLHVISEIDPRQGGTVSALVGLAAAQAGAGVQARVACTFRDGDDLSQVEVLRRQGVDVTAIGPARGPLRLHPEIKPRIAELVGQADVVHIHALWEEIQHRAARVAAKQGVPYLVSPHGMLDPWSLSQSRWKKRLYLTWRLRRNLNAATALHFTSPIEHQLTAPLRLRPPPVIEPNGLDLTEFQDLPPAGTARARHGVTTRRMLLFLSRLHPKKGLELLIPAFARADLPDTTLVLAGPDADGYRAKLERLAAEQGVADRVLFTGMLRGVDRLSAMADADLFVLPSYRENFGIAVAEALATGCPVLISDQVNIWQEIEAGGVGGVVPTRVEPLAAALRAWMVEDEPRRLAAAARAKAFATARYDWRALATRWAAHYENLKRRR
jgi:glycosyltransferase involved in cell wall biosynthesis